MQHAYIFFRIVSFCMQALNNNEFHGARAKYSLALTSYRVQSIVTEFVLGVLMKMREKLKSIARTFVSVVIKQLEERTVLFARLKLFESIYENICHSVTGLDF